MLPGEHQYQNFVGKCLIQKQALEGVAHVLVRCYPYRDGCLECCGAICLSLQCDDLYPIPGSLSPPPPQKKKKSSIMALACSTVNVQKSLYLSASD